MNKRLQIIHSIIGLLRRLINGNFGQIEDKLPPMSCLRCRDLKAPPALGGDPGIPQAADVFQKVVERLLQFLHLLRLILNFCDFLVTYSHMHDFTCMIYIYDFKHMIYRYHLHILMATLGAEDDGEAVGAMEEGVKKVVSKGAKHVLYHALSTLHAPQVFVVVYHELHLLCGQDGHLYTPYIHTY